MPGQRLHRRRKKHGIWIAKADQRAARQSCVAHAMATVRRSGIYDDIAGASFLGPLLLVIEPALLFAMRVAVANFYGQRARTGKEAAMEGYIGGWASAANDLAGCMYVH